MHRTVSVIVVLLICSLQLPAGHTLTGRQNAVIATWLKSHPSFRLATDADSDCADDIHKIRKGGGGQWKPVPNYHPYIATGDFNGDGAIDFAVAVVDGSRSTDRFTLLVFNGPVDPAHAVPAFTESGLNLAYSGLFYGPPRPKPYRLVLGRFEAEGLVLVPEGSTYRLRDFNP